MEREDDFKGSTATGSREGQWGGGGGGVNGPERDGRGGRVYIEGILYNLKRFLNCYF